MPKKKVEVENAPEQKVDEQKYDEIVSQMTEVAKNADLEPQLEEKEDSSQVADEVQQAETETEEDPVLTIEEIPKHYDAPQEPEYTQAEREAMEKGWKPQGEFDDPDKKFVSAEEYLGRGDLYEKISWQNKEIKKLTEGIQMLTDANKKQQEQSIKEKADYLLQQKREAIASGNVEEAENYEKAYNETQNDLSSIVPNPNQPAPAALDFAQRNSSWFNGKGEQQKEMTAFAISYENALSQSRPNMGDEDRLLQTEKAVRKAYSHVFVNPERPTAPKVIKSSPENKGPAVKTKKFTFNMAPSEAKAVIRSMARAANMTLDDYADQLHKSGAFD